MSDHNSLTLYKLIKSDTLSAFSLPYTKIMASLQNTPVDQVMHYFIQAPDI